MFSIALVLSGFGIVDAVIGYEAGFTRGGVIGLGVLLVMLREESINQSNYGLSFNARIEFRRLGQSM